MTTVVALSGAGTGACRSASLPPPADVESRLEGTFGRAVTPARWGAKPTVDGRFEQTVTVGDSLALDVRTASGRIEIRRGRPGEVLVTGSIRGYADRWTPDGAATVEDRVRRIEADPPIAIAAGDTLRIGLVGRSPHHQVAISYDLVVPPNTRVRARTGAGGLLVAGVRSVRGEISSGGTRMSDIAGDVMVKVGSGDIELTAVAGVVDVETGSGAIRITGVETTLRAWTGAGRIRIDGTPLDTWDLHAESGDIRIDVPDNAAFELDARTDSGAVRVDHQVTFRSDTRRGRYRGAVGGGGPRVSLWTGSGRIAVG